ncbi:MAG: pyruvate kinase [Acidiferrobacterales bacterium]|nr:pyruvate kinase [Acidiferrobacterales bacterium]
MVLRQTKIVATLGPATDSDREMKRLIEKGLNVVRVNLSHGTGDDHRKRIELVRKHASLLNRPIGILADLQGPKIRITRFIDGQVILQEGEKFELDAELEEGAGTGKRVGVTYKNLPRDVKLGDVLVIDDGNIVLRVTEVLDPVITTEVLVGGPLSDSKGINRQGGGLTAESLTPKDHQDIRLAGDIDVDYLAVSFVRNAVDVNFARELLRATGCEGGIVSKIERVEAVENFDEIVEASDGVMIARGDLAVEIGNAQLPGVQKRLIKAARKCNRFVITATQMMTSMITNTTPTRAEVLDVANAVLDGTDSVMLSQESAVGKHPAKVVATVNRICRGSESTDPAVDRLERSEEQFSGTEEAVGMATMYTARHFDVTAILSLTESGSTAKWLSQTLSGIPIYALTSHASTQRRVTMFRGVHPVDFEMDKDSDVPIEHQAVSEFLDRGIIEKGDILIVTRGEVTGIKGGTNTMKIITV